MSSLRNFFLGKKPPEDLPLVSLKPIVRGEKKEASPAQLSTSSQSVAHPLTSTDAFKKGNNFISSLDKNICNELLAPMLNQKDRISLSNCSRMFRQTYEEKNRINHRQFLKEKLNSFEFMHSFSQETIQEVINLFENHLNQLQKLCATLLKVPPNSPLNLWAFVYLSGDVSVVERLVERVKTQEERSYIIDNIGLYAGLSGSVEMIKYVRDLVQGIYPRACIDDLLLGAAASGNVKAMQCAMKFVKNYQHTNKQFQQNALLLAAREGALDAVKFAVTVLKNPVGSKDINKEGIAEYAARNGSVALMQFALQHNSNDYLKSDDYTNLARIAAGAGNFEMLDFIVKQFKISSNKDLSSILFYVLISPKQPEKRGRYKEIHAEYIRKATEYLLRKGLTIPPGDQNPYVRTRYRRHLFDHQISLEELENKIAEESKNVPNKKQALFHFW